MSYQASDFYRAFADESQPENLEEIDKLLDSYQMDLSFLREKVSCQTWPDLSLWLKKLSVLLDKMLTQRENAIYILVYIFEQNEAPEELDRFYREIDWLSIMDLRRLEQNIVQQDESHWSRQQGWDIKVSDQIFNREFEISAQRVEVFYECWKERFQEKDYRMTPYYYRRHWENQEPFLEVSELRTLLKQLQGKNCACGDRNKARYAQELSELVKWVEDWHRRRWLSEFGGQGVRPNSLTPHAT